MPEIGTGEEELHDHGAGRLTQLENLCVKVYQRGKLS